MIALFALAIITLPGNGSDTAVAVATDPAGNIVIAGNATSTNLATPGAYQTQLRNNVLYRLQGDALSPVPLVPPRYIDTFASTRISIFGAAYPVGLAQSSDGGQTWTTRLPALRITGLSATSDTVWAASTGAIYRSRDDGASWEDIAPPTPELEIGNLAADPLVANRLFVSGNITPASGPGRVASFRSLDGGRTWTELQPGFRAVVPHPSQRDLLYAYDYTSGYRSVDGGQTWTKLTFPVTGPVAQILPDPVRPARVYGLLGLFGRSLYVSENDGDTWQARSCGSSGCAQIAIDPQGVLYGNTSSAIIRSRDGGDNWQVLQPAQYFSTIGVAGSTLFASLPPAFDIFVTKLSPAGDILFTTYLGGSEDDRAFAVATDVRGDIYIAGTTTSKDFPGLSDSGNFLAKLSADGTQLFYSTATAGPVYFRSILPDSSGGLYFTGNTGRDYRTTPGVVQPQFCGSPYAPVRLGNPVVGRLRPDGSSVDFATYLGCLGDETYGLALDREGSLFVAGSQISKLDSSATRFIWSSAIEGGVFRSVAVGAGDRILLCGQAISPAFYTSRDALQKDAPPYFGASLEFDPYSLPLRDGFFTIMAPQGAITYSTFLGGNHSDVALSCFLDSSGVPIVAGTTLSWDFPTIAPTQGPRAATSAFLTQFSSANAVLSSTYFGDERGFSLVGMAPGPVLVGNTTPGPQDPDTHVLVSRISQQPPPMSPRVDAVNNTASNASGPISAGTLLTLTGQGLQNASVTLDGAQSAVLSSGPNEIRTVTPGNLPSTGTSTLQAGASNVVTMQRGAASPGIFTVDGTGLNQAVAFNEDGSQNSMDNRALYGSRIAIAVNGVAVAREQDVSLVIGRVRASGITIERLADNSQRIHATIPALVFSEDYLPRAYLELEVDGVPAQAGTWVELRQ